MKKAVWFIAGIGFLIRGTTGEYPLLPFILIGVVLLAVGVLSLFRKPKPKQTDSEKMLENIRNNRPIKL